MKPLPRLNAILSGVFITFLWSTSWVMIKIGLRGDLPPITFAGLRYATAFLCLLPIALLSPRHRAALQQLSRPQWLRLFLLGIVFITCAQGAQFISLSILPATMVSLIVNMSPVMVGLLTMLASNEPPTGLQWTGVALAALGTGIYFLPLKLTGVAGLSLGVAFFCLLSNSTASLQTRQINQDRSIDPLLVTLVSMGSGGVLLLVIGLIFQGLGKPSLLDWGFIAWMAVVNTAFCFTVWNRILQTLTAVEGSILNSLIMPQVALLAVIFLGERLSLKEIAGLVLVGCGVIVVQLRQARRE